MMILGKDSHTVKFKALKYFHPVISSVAFSFDYDLDTFSFTLSLSLLESPSPAFSNQWRKNYWPRFCFPYTNGPFQLYDFHLKWALCDQDVSVYDCTITAL